MLARREDCEEAKVKKEGEIQEHHLELVERKMEREYADRKEQCEAMLELRKLEIQAWMQEIELARFELQVRMKEGL